MTEYSLSQVEDDPPELVAAEEKLAQLQIGKGSENSGPEQGGDSCFKEVAICGTTVSMYLYQYLSPSNKAMFLPDCQLLK